MVHAVGTTHARRLDCLDRSLARTGRWNALERVFPRVERVRFPTDDG